jgi:uncharacterized membrane-anchored protein YitT (DUF2179 family)
MGKKIRYKQILLIAFGNGLLAIASAFFLIPLRIVNGGMNGIAIVVNAWLSWPIDLTTAGLAWFLFFLGFIFLGKSFSIRTLLATILYPIFLFLLLRFVGEEFLGFSITNDTHILLASIFGGGLVGIGIGVSFLAGGSTGGFDVVMLMGEKYAGWKPSITSLVMDGFIIGLGMLTYGVIAGLFGILSTMITSWMIEMIFAGYARVYMTTIISSKPQVINRYILDQLERGSTLYPAKGGYSQQALEVIQVAVNREEFFRLKQFIASVDDQAFVMMHPAQTIHGLGFNPLMLPPLVKSKPKKATKTI